MRIQSIVAPLNHARICYTLRKDVALHMSQNLENTNLCVYYDAYTSRINEMRTNLNTVLIAGSAHTDLYACCTRSIDSIESAQHARIGSMG